MLRAFSSVAPRGGASQDNKLSPTAGGAEDGKETKGRLS